MADNTRGGSNDSGLPLVASDDIAGVQYQRVKPVWGVDGSAVDTSATNPLPVVQTGTPALPTGAASSANQTTELTDLGAVTETAPASDTASSGLNGRLQRIAQRITSLIALLPTSLGQKTKAGSLAVTLASDSDALAISGSVTASGTLDVSSVIPGVAATSLGKAEDAAHTTGDTGVMALAVRNDAGTVLAGTTGDYIPLSADSAGAVRVNVASGTLTAVTSITNAVSVNDGSGSLTVDGTVAVSGVTPGTAATNLGKVEDAAHTTGDVGVMPLAVRNDAGTALAGTTGDYIPFTTDSSGALRVTGGGGGTQYTEDVAAAGAESLTLAGTVRQDTPASSNADGDYANLKTDSVGRLWANASGPEVGIVTETAPASDTASSGLNGRLQRIAQRLTSIIALLPASVGQKTKAGSLPVTLASDEDALAISGSVTATGTLDVTSVIAGTGATNLGKAEDAAHTTGDVGVMGLAVRNDAGTALAGTTGDYIPLSTDASGSLRVTGSGGTGDVAHDAADSGNPVKIGGYANTGGPAAVANGDRVNAWFGLNGELVVALGSGVMTAADGAANTNQLALINPGGSITAGMLPVIPYLTNGTTFDRLRGDTANGLDVDVTRVPGTATNASGQATISSTSATVIASRAGRRGVMVINNQPVPIYLDPAGGTATTANARLDPGAAMTLPVTSAITAITAAAYSAVGDAKVHYVELFT